MSLSRRTNRSTSPQKDCQSPLRATNATSVFKSTGREKGASWGNRIIKDFNDLTYDTHPSQFNNIKYSSKSPNQFRMRKKFSVGQCKKKDQKHFDKQKFRLELMQTNKISNPEKINLIEQERYSTLQTQGLCKFQFDKTIAGRLKYRGHRHLDFNNQTIRDLPRQSPQKDTEQLNQSNNKIFNNTISFSRFQRSPKNDPSNKCHQFKSYSPRKVFEPKQQLDKIYDVDHYFRVIKKNNIKQTVKMQKLTGRKQQKVKQSSTLAYNEYESRQYILNSAQSHQIQRSPRVTQFGKQVILYKRGCYR